ncbi:MAG: hypothetical protein IPM17_12560 [Verrucomicrobia bacterium]|nr:hypothetical protein [Verrucomicrobiota bacterium]
MKTTLPTVCLLALAGLSVQGGEFRNLGFEDADPELLIGSTWGHWDRMIPGWTPVRAGGWVGYNQPIGMEGYFMLIDDWGRERTPVLSLCPVVDRLAIGVIPNAYLTLSGEPPPPHSSRLAWFQTGLPSFALSGRASGWTCFWTAKPRRSHWSRSG